MRRCIILLLFIISLSATAQQYGNEWIRHHQTYYKFKVGSKGLYRISKSLLDNAGIGNTDVQFFELWRNGKPVPLYPSASSGQLPVNGYLEFWGEGNDGAPDRALYANPANQHSTQLSLLTDTATYFLSVNTSQSGFFFTDIENKIAGNLLPVEPYFMNKTGVYFKDRLQPGYAEYAGEYVYSSQYDKGEFWTSGYIRPAAPLARSQPIFKPYAGGPDATIRFGIMGDAENPRSVRVSVNNLIIKDTVMNKFNDIQSSSSIPVSALSSGTPVIRFYNTSTVSTDRIVVSFYEIIYPGLFDFNNQKSFKFHLAASASGKYLEIRNFNYGATPPVLLDLTTGARITGDISTPGVVKLVAPSGGERDFVLVNVESANTIQVGSLTQKKFKNYADAANQGDYLIITHSSLFKGANGGNPIQEYKNYRSLAEGGSFDVEVVDIDELVDQFAFGIKKNPLSIKNFLRYARNTFSAPLRYVLLIGRGMTYSQYRQNESLPNSELLNLVPTFGDPASDNMLSSEDAASPIAITPIGRLSVVRGSEIEDYLEKLKEYENVQKTAPNTLAGRGWMKNIVHVTGSSDPYLGTVLCNYMSVYRQIIEDTAFGGRVVSFCKTTTNAVEQLNSERITQLFQEGISILTYFGHSSSTTLEFNLDNPQNYQNQGKYPVFFVNGCNAGNFYTYNVQRLHENETLSEKFVLAKQRGSIAFVASTHYGIVNHLNIYLNNLYRTITGTDYGKPLGEIVRDGLNKMNVVAGTTFFSRLHAEQMTVHGDPAIYFNQQAKPDYMVEESQVMVNPAFISVAEEDFKFKVRLVNAGKAASDSVGVEIKRQYPNGTTEILSKIKIRGIRYEDSLILDIPILPTRDKGLNRITVSVDPDNDIDEMSESNNVVVKEVFIFEDEARGVYPYNYSIINKANQKLYASTADPFSLMKNYQMELDTTELFNSSMKVSKSITSVGGTLEFDPGITYQDSVVYYWRVGIVPASGGEIQWSNSSFSYIQGNTTGSGQSHFFQNLRSRQERVQLDSVDRNWKFGTAKNNVTIKNAVFPSASDMESEFSILVNEKGDIASACVGSSLIFNVFDPVTFKPWKNVDENGNNLFLSGSGIANCAPTRNYNFEFPYGAPEGRKKMMNFMDSIPKGYYVVVRSFDTPNDNTFYSATWRGDTALYGTNNSLYHRLFAAGMMDIDSINAPKVWLFMYRKDDYSFLPVYKVTKGIFDKLSVAVVVSTPDTIGTISSPVFGPAKEWKEVIWKGFSEETPSTDNPTVDVIGLDALQQETLLYTLDRDTRNFDLSSVNVANYPYMRLRMRNIDSVSLTPFQLQSWKIHYVPVPEGALAANILLTAKDTLEIGEPYSFSIAFKNISIDPFDSIAVKGTILDNNNVPHPIVFPKQKPLVSGDTIVVRYNIDTKEYPLGNTLYIEVNPDQAQPEQLHTNNFLYRNFYVKTDLKNPFLDVTFDGVHILNRDIVSAKPHIQIKLKDDAKFLLLNDTVLNSVQLRYPDGSIRTHRFDNDTLRFTPATTGADNTAVIDFTPQFSKQYNPEGDEYELIVNGKDRSGNKAGSEYRIAFTVISKPMISNLLNYPNPFSSSTAFVFTVTGSEIPQNMKIQVLTVTGKVVREITKEELGPVHIGRNITEFKWDGTDQFGQKLGNGVYLYRFVASLNGKRMEKYKSKDDNTDVFFNNGYGKMYLMR